MDLGDTDKYALGKRSGDHMNYQTPGISADRQLSNPPMGLGPTDTPVPQGDQMASSQCPSISMAESFLPTIWSHPSTSHHNLGFSENNAQIDTSTSNNVAVGKPVAVPSRLDMCWNPSNSLCKGMFLQTFPGILPPSLAHLQADSAFIERAARFSCFNVGTLNAMVNPFGVSKSSIPYSNALRDISGAQTPKPKLNLDISMPIDHGSNSGSLMKGQRDKSSSHGVGVSSNESGEAEPNAGSQEEAASLASDSGGSSSKRFNAKKRKKANQDMELDQGQGAPASPTETTKVSVDTKQKGEQNSSAMDTGRNAKDGSEALKEDYIHMRARRGQATNSHSLAERVRREKISERMKFLQDLVPGCSKVTGKALMLDEIINYVQSLQRQVEFLSMKLAAVSPRLDSNIEGLLSKDLLQSRGAPPSSISFSLDITHPQLHPPYHGLVQSGIPGILNPADALGRTINAQLTAISGYKEPTPQMSNAWDDELHNVVQMTYGANPTLSAQDLNGKPHDGFPL